MTTINDRVKFVRNKLGLTQTIFGEKLAATQTYLSQIEKGDKPVTEKILKIICLEFNVSEHWLRTGEGEMIIENDNTILSEISKQYNLTNADKVFFKTFLKCSPEQRAVLKQVAFKLLDTITEDPELLAEYQRSKKECPIDNLPIAASLDSLTYKQKQSLILAELEAQEKTKTSSATIGTNGSSLKIG